MDCQLVGMFALILKKLEHLKFIETNGDQQNFEKTKICHSLAMEEDLVAADSPNFFYFLFLFGCVCVCAAASKFCY